MTKIRNAITKIIRQCENCPQIIHIGSLYFTGKELDNKILCLSCGTEVIEK